jgi:glycosyltransferase involved in cell wall biosynthesis
MNPSSDSMRAATTTQQRRRVAYVHHGSEIGGAPVSLAALIKRLQVDPSVAITIYCVYPGIQEFFKTETTARIESICNPGLILGRVLIGYAVLTSPMTVMQTVKDLLLLPSRVYRQYKLFSKLDDTIVHLNSSILFGSAIAAKLAGRKVVWHVREMPTGGKYSIRRILVGWFIRRLADEVIAISPSEKWLIGGQQDPKVKVVYNFLKDAQPTSDTRDRHEKDQPRQTFEVLSLGGVSPRKGTTELLEAMAHVRHRIRLTLAGSGSIAQLPSSPIHMALLRMAWATEDRLIRSHMKTHRTWYYGERTAFLLRAVPADRVHLAGKLNDVHEVLRSCDALIFAGTTPHFPRPIYEAWLHRKPVLAFDIPGVAENIVDGKDGKLVYPCTGLELARAIDWLVESPVCCSQFGQHGYQKAQARFSETQNVSAIRNIYNDLWQQITKESTV